MGEDETTDTIDEDVYDSSAYIISDEVSIELNLLSCHGSPS